MSHVETQTENQPAAGQESVVTSLSKPIRTRRQLAAGQEENARAPLPSPLPPPPRKPTKIKIIGKYAGIFRKAEKAKQDRQRHIRKLLASTEKRAEKVATELLREAPPPPTKIIRKSVYQASAETTKAVLNEAAGHMDASLATEAGTIVADVNAAALFGAVRAGCKVVRGDAQVQAVFGLAEALMRGSVLGVLDCHGVGVGD
ncbi:hypothetical protein QBC47DRAFT_407256 [Echria macrotheca]|uniref:Uncharacterized protein n=1 Tax=Echria macrotheca TaxID=438768 RepID=A0AAJ0B2A9_9PEZI|nr:hypothetical protein QBC47DRAFT_407256 [Echria macrotheca]